MKMEEYIQVLTDHVLALSPNYGDGDSLLTMLYETYSDSNRLDNDTIKRDFAELYRCMNGKQLWQKDEIVDPVCALCRDHEKAGFVTGVKVGIRLHNEIMDN